MSFSQNLSFDYITPNYSGNNYGGKAATYGYYGVTSIDAPQRFGDSAFWNYDWGDSEIRWSWHTFTLGIGTQNPWLGPAWLNPMLGSNNAAGYLKFDVGLRKTEIFIPYFYIPLGTIEARICLGHLKESDYYDETKSNDDRMLTALSASYNPSFIPGFSIGLKL